MLVAVPHSLLLLPLSQSACAPCDAHELLALRLLEEREKGGRSGWAPYVALLPAEPDTGASLSTEDVELLHGTYAGGVVGTVRARVGRFVARARSGGVAYSEEALRWAMAVVVSRAVEVRAPTGGGGGGGSGARAINASAPYGVPFFAPGADLLNHGPNARVGWALSAEAPAAARQLEGRGGGGNSVAARGGGARALPPVFSVVTLTPYGAGGEVFNSYHDAAGCAHLLAHYGFGVLHNPHDAVALSFPVAAPAGARGGGGWVTLVEGAAAGAAEVLVAHARALREEGLLDDGALAAAVGALPAPGAVRLANATLLLRARAGGAPPAALLNLARLVVLASGGAEAAAEADAARKALADAALRATFFSAWGGAEGTLAELLTPPALGGRSASGGGGGGGAPALTALAVGADGAVSAGVPPPVRAPGTGALVDTVALLEGVQLSVSVATDAAAHQVLLRALARLRGRYFSEGSEGGGAAEGAAIAAQMERLEAVCSAAAGLRPVPRRARRALLAPGGAGRGATRAAGGGEGPEGAPPSPSPSPTAPPARREAAAAAAGARAAAELPALRRRAAVFACRDSERAILSATSRALSERLVELLAAGRRSGGGSGAAVPPPPSMTLDEELGALEDRGGGAVLAVALSYATGHVHDEAGGVGAEAAAAGARAGAANASGAPPLRGNLRAGGLEEEAEEGGAGGAHRTERA